MKSSFFIVILLIYNISSAQSLLPAKITVEKSLYLLGEPVNVKLIIKNTTTKLVTINTYQFVGNFIVEDENKNKLKLLFRTSSESNWYLFPGDSIIKVFNVAAYFGRFTPGDQETHFGLPEGSYSIQFLKTQNEFNIMSNIVSISLAPPQGDENEAFESYNQAWHSNMNNKLFRASAFMDVINKYPRSVYVLASLTWIQPEDAGRIITEFPNSYQSWYIINDELVDFKLRKEKSGAEMYLREIIRKKPGSFAATVAFVQLDKIQSLTLEEWLKPELAIERRLSEYQLQNKQ